VTTIEPSPTSDHHPTHLPGTPRPSAGALSDTAILAAVKRGQISITPFDRARVGSNSYDVHLGRVLARYTSRVLDCARQNEVEYIEIPPTGYLLEPGVLYLGVTREHTETHGLLPWIDGCSSLARLGVSVHQAAGRGDVGFCGHWTLEIVVQRTRPRPWWASFWPWYREGVIVYPNQRIGQITWFEVSGEVAAPYNKKSGAKYADGNASRDPYPRPSRSWKEFLQPLEGDRGEG
jgi:dCTP deaminase